MKLQSNFTTTEQSKRLLEMGVPAWTADCFHTTDLQHNPIEDATPAIITYQLDTHEIEWDKVYGVPCWSVGRLVEIYHICVSKGFSFNVCFPNLMNEVMYRLTEANNNGWLNLSKLNDYETTE